MGPFSHQGCCDKSSAKAVTAAYAVYNVHMVFPAEIKIRPVIEHGGPVIVIGRDRFPQGDSDL